MFSLQAKGYLPRIVTVVMERKCHLDTVIRDRDLRQVCQRATSITVLPGEDFSRTYPLMLISFRDRYSSNYQHFTVNMAL